MTTAPVTPERIQIAVDYGIENADILAVVCREVGIPFWAACALMEKESMGRNVYGHDAGGALSGFEQPVTRRNFEVFEWLVFDKGQTSNGVGPCQITWKGYFGAMRDAGLKAWDVHDNMLFGLRLLWHYYEASESWAVAGQRYNGAAAYGRDLAVKVLEWRKRLRIGDRP